MFALGMLCGIYSFDLKLARDQIAQTFGKKVQSIIDSNERLLQAGHKWAEKLEFKYKIPTVKQSTNRSQWKYSDAL